MRTRAIQNTIELRTSDRLRLLVVGLFLIAAQVGCRHIGPTTIMKDRLPYNQAVAESWNEQTLLNIVKMRYEDTFMFSEVSQIISSYSLDRSGDVDVGFVPGGAAGIAASDRIRSLFNLRANLSDRPTITYTPQTDSEFISQLAKPLPPKLILYLTESGYPVDVVFDLTVESINGISNRKSSGIDFRPAEAEFTWLLQVLRRAQLSRAVSMRVEVDEEKNSTTILMLRPDAKDLDSQLMDDLRSAKELLNLDPEVHEFKVVLGAAQGAPNEIAIKTRPVLRVLSSLAQFVDVPEKHLLDGSAQSVDLGGCAKNPPLRVYCSDEPPPDCFVAVPYRGCWYWLSDCDFNSKRTLIYLFVFLAHAERGSEKPLPLVTIPAGQVRKR